MTSKYDKEHPHYMAKRVVYRHEFSSFSSTSRARTVMRGGYSTPSDMAQGMLDAYFHDGENRAEHDSIAVAAIYAASVVFNCRENQIDLGELYDVSPSTIRRHYEHMLDRVMPPLNDEYDVH